MENVESNTDIPRKKKEEYQLVERVRRKFRQGLKSFSLIEDGDSLLVGLSGGKDSMALLELLGEYRKHKRNTFNLVALHVRMTNVDYQTDDSYLKCFSERCGATFVLRTTSFVADERINRTPCFLCSWNRRKTFFETAQEFGCNKIALGHHQDDILKTALMNLTFNGSFSTMPAFLKMRKMPLVIIRPLCRIEEEDLKKWSVFRHYRPLLKKCPHEKESNRTNIDNVVNELQKINPEFRYNLWHALEKDGKMVEK